MFRRLFSIKLVFQIIVFGTKMDIRHKNSTMNFSQCTKYFYTDLWIFLDCNIALKQIWYIAFTAQKIKFSINWKFYFLCHGTKIVYDKRKKFGEEIIHRKLYFLCHVCVIVYTEQKMLVLIIHHIFSFSLLSIDQI